MVTTEERKRTIQYAMDEQIKDWWVVGLVNDMLKKLNVDAKFSYNEVEDNLLTLEVGVE